MSDVPLPPFSWRLLLMAVGLGGSVLLLGYLVTVLLRNLLVPLW